MLLFYNILLFKKNKHQFYLNIFRIRCKIDLFNKIIIYLCFIYNTNNYNQKLFWQAVIGTTKKALDVGEIVL